MIVLFFFGCAAKSDIKKSESITPVYHEDEVQNILPSSVPALEDIEVLKENERCRVKITATTPPTFTVFKLTQPERIILDLPEILLDNNQKLLEVQNDYITEIKSTQLQDKGKTSLRVEIGLTDDFSYNALNENNSILIDLSPKPSLFSGTEKQKSPQAKTDEKKELDKEKPALTEKTTVTNKMTKDKTSIKDIKVSQTPEGHKITIVADTEIEKYHSYSLQKPNRLAIDLPMTKSLLKKPLFDIRNPLIEKVRVGQKPDKVRIVIDLKGERFPLYQIAQERNYLDISIKEEKEISQNREKQQKISYDSELDEITLPKENEPESPKPKEYTGEKISLDFKDADIKNVLRLIADISGLNMIVSENVKGKVTLKLEKIPWDEALDIILDINHAGKIVTGNVTRIETIDHIKKINEEKLLAKKSQENLEELEVKTLDISYAKAQDLSRFIKTMNILSPRGSVTDFKLTNKLTIQDIPSNVLKIEQIVREQDVPTRQVMIEARIVQSNPSYVKELGIRWGGLYNTTHNNDAINLSGAAGDDFVVNLPAAAGEGSGGAINFGYIKDNLQLNVQLTALENEDKIKIISNPRILGLDNKEARIKQGVALPYLKLSEEGVTSTEFKDAVLELEVTPKITPANTIALHIYVTKNQKSSQTGAGNEPGIDVREVETDLLVKSGVTVVIGGIYETQKTQNITKVPLFGDIPGVGRFFRNKREEDLLTELLVFLTVTVVDQPDNIAKDMNEISG
jgi:type IV pilus assembly protein PilQ